MTTLTDAELIDRVARAWASMDGHEIVFEPSKRSPQKETVPAWFAESYRSDAKELLTRAGIITPAELERREGEG